MCLIVFSWQPDSALPLLLAANRDEFYERPTEPMHWWPGDALLAGRDGREGGTWLGLTRQGRFAALTNFRDPAHLHPNAPSRGQLPLRFLQAKAAPQTFLETLHTEATAYNGFNLLVGDLPAGELWAYGNHAPAGPQRVAPGVHGLSNALLDTPWPKVERSKQRLATVIAGLPRQAAPLQAARDALLDLMRDSTPAADAQLPSTGVSPDWERLLSPPFIRSTSYGTRSTTLLLANRAGADVMELTHAQAQQAEAERSFSLVWQAAPERRPDRPAQAG